MVKVYSLIEVFWEHWPVVQMVSHASSLPENEIGNYLSLHELPSVSRIVGSRAIFRISIGFYMGVYKMIPIAGTTNILQRSTDARLPKKARTEQTLVDRNGP